MISKRLHPASFSNVNTQLAQIPTNGAVMTNAVTNGDFSNGTTGWTAFHSVLSANANTLSAVGSGIKLTIGTRSLNAMTIGNIYYFRAKVRVRDSVSSKIGIGSGTFLKEQLTPVQDAWYALSNRGTATQNDFYIYSYYADAATANGKVMEVQYCLAIDLTATFGAGNEPTAAQMDELLAFYNNSWFNGNANITDLLQYVVSRKANKTQAAWITPTLLNAWAYFGSVFLTEGYMKDEFGFVHFKGVITGVITTAGTTIFVLPVGYRPPATVMLDVNSNDGRVRLHVAVNGEVSFGNNGVSGFLCLDNCSFYVG